MKTGPPYSPIENPPAGTFWVVTFADPEAGPADFAAIHYETGDRSDLVLRLNDADWSPGGLGPSNYADVHWLSRSGYEHHRVHAPAGAVPEFLALAQGACATRQFQPLLDWLIEQDWDPLLTERCQYLAGLTPLPE